MKKYYNILSEARRAQLTKLAIAGGTVLAVGVPTAIVIACNGDESTTDETNAYRAELEKLQVDVINSTTDSISWQGVTQVPIAYANAVAAVEYLVGDYPTVAIAQTAPGWSRTLPRTVTPLDGIKLWARLITKPNYTLTTTIFDLTTTSKVALVKTASDPNSAVRTIDAQALSELLKQVSYVGNSVAERIYWQGTPEVPEALKQDVEGVQYLVGNFATEQAASASDQWSSTLLTTVSGLAKTERKVWARLLPKPKVTLAPQYVDLSTTTKIEELVAKSAPQGSSIATSWIFNSHREVQVIAATANSKQTALVSQRDYFTPGVEWSTSDTNYGSLYSAMQLNIFRAVKPFEDRVEYDENYKVKSVTASNTTRAGRLRFEIIKAIVLTDELGKEYVFDKDVSPNDLLSNDPRDVNSQFFRDTFLNVSGKARIAKMEFKLRDNAPQTYWRQNFTGKNGSAVTAKDLYLGTIWGLLGSPKSRVPYSGLSVVNAGESITGSFVDVSNAIHAAIGEAGDGDRGLELPNKSAPYALLSSFDNIGLDNAPFTDLNNMNKAVIDDQTFVLTFKKEPKDSVTNRDNFLAYFTRNWLCPALPYDATRALVNDAEVNRALDNAIASANLTADQKTKFTNSLAYKVGYYHHFFGKKENFYTAGKYYLQNVAETEIVGKINENYIDSRWTNQRNIAGQRTTIDTYRIKYQLANGSDTNDWIEFQNGNSVSSKDSGLTVNQQQEAVQNPFAYGTKYTRGFSSMGSVWNNEYTSLTMMPVYQKNYPILYFNNNFSKTMYGATAEEIDKQEGKYNNGGIIDTLASGTGFELRKLLSASMNAFTFVKERFPDSFNRVDWTSLFSPEQDLVGSDLKQDAAIHLIDQIFPPTPNAPDNGFNDEGFLNKYVFEKGANGTWAVTPFSRQSYVDQFNNATFSDKYGPSKTASVTDPLNPAGKMAPFDLLKRAVKNLLDRTVGAYDANNPEATQLIWEMPYSRGRFQENGSSSGFSSVRSQQLYKAYKQMLSTLDPRLRIVATVEPTSKSGTAETGYVYKDVTVITEDWPGDSTWVALTETEDVDKKFPNSYTSDRNQPTYQGRGLGMAAIRQGKGSFSFNAPTEVIYYNFGWLQNGHMLLQSYFADTANARALDSPILAPLRNLIDIIKRLFNEYMAKATLETTKFISSKKQVFLDAIKNLKFEDVWKSDLKTLDKYDYVGFKGLEAIISAHDALEARVNAGETLTEDEQKTFGGWTYTDENGVAQTDFGDYQRTSDYLNDFFNGSVSADVWNELRKLNTKDLLDTLLAWQIVSPDNMNPTSSSIGDRTVLSRTLVKSWYHAASGTFDGLPINMSSNRVDLDHQHDFYLGLPLYQDINGNWKTAFDGGIVY